MRSIALVFSLFFIVSVFSQSEFEEHDNGLIYSQKTMSKLSQIVDSENHQFRVCNLTKKYKSREQGYSSVFQLSSKLYRKALKDIKANISKNEFIAKYGKAKLNKELAVRQEYLNYEDEEYLDITLFPSEISMDIKKEEFNKYKIGSWLIKKKYNGKVWVLYFDTPLTVKSIPDYYGRMLMYSECMIDTTTTIHPKSAIERGGYYSLDEDLPAQKQLLEYITVNFGEKPPVFEDENNSDDAYEKFWTENEKYNERKHVFIENTLLNNSKFKTLLENAYQESIKKGGSLPTFEKYVEQYLSKKKALELKRNRIVYGSCSMDSSPRYHARDIARLAADSFSWDIFLRAHLNIMNDNFQRASDGNYAWGARKTYIKELEELNINVKDLLLGISLRISNTNENHYYGSVRRLGRAIAESSDVADFKNEIVTAIENKNLDDYNRIMMFYLYVNLQYNLDKMEDRDFDQEKVLAMRDKLPAYLKTLKY